MRCGCGGHGGHAEGAVGWLCGGGGGGSGGGYRKRGVASDMQLLAGLMQAGRRAMRAASGRAGGGQRVAAMARAAMAVAGEQQQLGGCGGRRVGESAFQRQPASQPTDATSRPLVGRVSAVTTSPSRPAPPQESILPLTHSPFSRKSRVTARDIDPQGSHAHHKPIPLVTPAANANLHASSSPDHRSNCINILPETPPPPAAAMAASNTAFSSLLHRLPGLLTAPFRLVTPPVAWLLAPLLVLLLFAARALSLVFLSPLNLLARLEVRMRCACPKTLIRT